MPSTSRTLRLALLTVSGSLAAGAVLLPTGAFAAPAAPHAVTLPADRGGHDRDGSRGGDRNDGGRHDDGSQETPTDETPAGEADDPAGPTDTEPAETDSTGTGPADSEDGIVSQEHCNDPRALPGLCVDGKPLPKGDNSVVVPMAPQLCLGIDTPEQCAERQKPRLVVESPTGSSTTRLAV
ncbi:hypothetical protein ACIBTP_07615 [Streptomyces avidinii]|uniref:hypothetical protein n=1 Tax=Streptomyces avidinii TaxID=1895 RepID=UPI0037A66535